MSLKIRPFYVSIMLFTGYLTHLKWVTCSNASHPIYQTYAKLRQQILDRPASVHKIPPSLETGYQKRYDLQMSNLVVDIHSFDEIKQMMTLQMYFNISWYHSELSWNPSHFDNITAIWLDSTDVWTPTIEVNMGYEGSSTLELNGKLKIFPDGAVVFMKLGFLTFACIIDFNNYPFDTQSCHFGFYPHGPPMADPKLYNSTFPIEKFYTVSKEWLVRSIEMSILDFVETGNPIVVKVPTYQLIVQRNSLYYVVSIVFPMVLTSAMIPLVFIIPTQTGEKVSYLVALFTSTAIFLNYISDVMPRCLTRMPYLAILLIEVLVEGMLAMLATLLVVNLHVREDTETQKNVELKGGKKAGMFAHKLTTSTETSDVTKNNALLALSRISSPKRLDQTFFIFFTIGQITFLLLLFLGTEWAKGGIPRTQ